MYKGKKHEEARKRITKLATEAKQALKDKNKKKLTELIESLTEEMKPKFLRFFAKLENRRMYSPIDAKNHDIDPWDFEDYIEHLDKKDKYRIVHATVRGYDPSRGPFLPYANRVIYYHFLKEYHYLFQNFQTEIQNPNTI